MDLVGHVYGHWTVIACAKSKGWRSRWLCRCVCGKQKEVDQSNLRGGISTNCGCCAYRGPKGKDASICGETWRDYPGEVHGSKLQASSAGRIRNARNGHIYRGQVHVDGYVYISVKSKLVKAHRIICASFHPNPQNLATVNHKDGIRSNNDPINLEWMTQADNARHAWTIGLCSAARGEDNGASKLTEVEVLEIRKTYSETKVKQVDLAAKYGVSQRMISLIVRKEKWTHV